MIYHIDENVEIVADGERILLEKGDEVDLPGVEPTPEDKLPGGYADDETVQSIAAKHGVDVESILKQLEMGIEVEYEHTNDRNIAREIALDHLFELPDYYTRLAQMEKEGEAALKEDTLSEAAIRRCYLHICDGEDREYYITAPSAHDNYIIRFLARLCRDHDYGYDADVVESVPPGGKRKSVETFLRTLP